MGVAFIILSDENISGASTEFNYKILGGYILAFAGGYMIAMSTMIQGVFSEYFYDLKDDFGAALLGQAWGRTISVAIGSILYLFFAEQANFTEIQWVPTLFIGIIVLMIGTALYLASSASDFVTGQTIVVDGGRQFN